MQTKIAVAEQGDGFQDLSAFHGFFKPGTPLEILCIFCPHEQGSFRLIRIHSIHLFFVVFCL